MLLMAKDQVKSRGGEKDRIRRVFNTRNMLRDGSLFLASMKAKVYNLMQHARMLKES